MNKGIWWNEVYVPLQSHPKNIMDDLPFSTSFKTRYGVMKVIKTEAHIIRYADYTPKPTKENKL
jgi:hypothetical protein